MVRTDLATSPRSQPVEDHLHRRGLPLVHLIETAGDGCVQGVALTLIELIPFVVDDEVEDSALRKVRRLVHDQSAVSNGGTNAHRPERSAVTVLCLSRPVG